MGQDTGQVADFRKAWYKSKTMAFNAVLVLSGAVSMLEPVLEQLEAVGMSAQTVATLRIALILNGVVGVLLRQGTEGGVKL